MVYILRLLQLVVFAHRLIILRHGAVDTKSVKMADEVDDYELEKLRAEIQQERQMKYCVGSFDNMLTNSNDILSKAETYTQLNGHLLNQSRLERVPIKAQLN